MFGGMFGDFFGFGQQSGGNGEREMPKGGDVVVDLDVSLEELYNGQFIEGEECECLSDDALWLDVVALLMLVSPRWCPYVYAWPFTDPKI